MLSHAGKERGSGADAYTWIGNMAYRYGKYSSPPKRKKKPKRKCKLCGGSLGPFYGTLRSFFKVWLGIKFEKGERRLKEFKGIVLHAVLPTNIKNNVLEALDVLQTGKPPPNYKEFLVEWR